MTSTARAAGAAILLAVLAAGCAEKREPIDPDTISRPDEMQRGPGLFSGEDGKFTIEMAK
jgi:hypothetical protein